ncbi:MAG TPA: hypothetical protein PKZ16_02420 [bacterium]|nr:hypothetical protein [bacterium]HPL95821.1 hypothetical protein [bacterium]
MRLSNLQKYILLECAETKKGMISRGRLTGFYDKIKTEKKAKQEIWTKIITQSIERLIDKEFLIGFGERTRYKWFIKEIKLTTKGRKEAKRLLGEQMRIPFRNNNRN